MHSIDAPVVKRCIRIYNDLSWTVTVHGQQVNSCAVLSTIPPILSIESCKSLLTLVATSNVCTGHPDQHFVSFLEAKKGKLLSKDGKNVSAFIDANSVLVNGRVCTTTIRCSSCELLVNRIKCSQCVAYRSSLRTLHRRWMKKNTTSPSTRTSASSKTNFRYLNTPERQQRFSNLHMRVRADEKKIMRLRSKIDVLTKKDGVNLDGNASQDFVSIMEEMTDKVRKDYPVNSFRRVFWEQQLKAICIKDKRQIRWHPALIKWCLHLKYLSSGAFVHPCR